MGIEFFKVSIHLLRFRPFRIMCVCMLIQGKIAKYRPTWEENGMYGGNV
jgi:hypothetical protein